MKRTILSTVLAFVVVMMFLPVIANAEPPEKAQPWHLAYNVKNYDETAAFYKNILGVDFPKQTYAVNKLELEKGAFSEGKAPMPIELMQIEQWTGAEAGVGSAHIGFLVQNIEKMHEYVKSQGLTPSEIMTPFPDNPNLRIFYFRGPNNETFELVEIKPVEPPKEEPKKEEPKKEEPTK